MAKLHVISGKGGVGKSTLSAALAKAMDRSKPGPILLLEIESEGETSKLLGLEGPLYRSKKVLHSNNIWVSTLDGENCFKEYFTRLFNRENTDETVIQGVFKNISEKIINGIIENKIVKAFINVCPGLKPIVILGKLCWEAEKGLMPESSTPWHSIIVDAPSSGYVKMLFKSMMALKKVFPVGRLHKQASDSITLVTNPEKLGLHIVSLLEELPLTESVELKKDMDELNIHTQGIFYNKAPFEDEIKKAPESAPEKIKEFIESEIEIQEEKIDLLKESSQSENFKNLRQWKIVEHYSPDLNEQLESISNDLYQQGVLER